MQKVIVGISGGVDSSVCAWLLQQQGYEVEGLFMKNWEQDDDEEQCAAAKDLADAQAVCNQLGIRLHTVNFSQNYWDEVFVRFLDELNAGRTPNPDVLCNQIIKFNIFLQYSLNLGADYIATGHYARTLQGKLLKAKDPDKDQTYFLHGINPEVLNKTLFPIGDFLKTEVRDLAQRIGLVTYDKRDSTGICFIGEKRFKTFLKEYILAKPGKICNPHGQEIGEHEGLMFYTIGQRQGLGLGGGLGNDNSPWYVIDKDLSKNILIVAQGETHPLLYSQGLICENFNWLIDSVQFPLQAKAKIRYRQLEQACIITEVDNNKYCVQFVGKQRAITPGQYVVLYNQEECLGGAVIDSVIR